MDREQQAHAAGIRRADRGGEPQCAARSLRRWRGRRAPAAPAEPAEPAGRPAATSPHPRSRRAGRRDGGGRRDVRPGLRARRDDRALRVGRLRRHRRPGCGRPTPTASTGKKSPLKFDVPRERHPGARQGGVRLQPRRHPPVHRLLAGLAGSGPDPAVRHGAAPRLRGHPRGDPRAGVGDDGLVYHVPFDIGFSTLVYRADKIPITPEEESWSILLDPAYEGKLATYSDPVTIIKIGALINAGEPIDPNKLTTEQIEAAKETMIQAKPQIRELLGQQPRQHRRLHQRQRLGDLHVARRLPPGHLTRS